MDWRIKYISPLELRGELMKLMNPEAKQLAFALEMRGDGDDT